MGIGQNAVIFSIILCLCFYIGGVRVFQEDALTKMFDISDEDNPRLSSQLDSRLPKAPYSSASQLGVSYGFIDGLFLIYDIVLLFINVIIAPVGVLHGILPTPIILLLGVPLMLFNILGIVSLVRGNIGW
jgi:hypothetical protein